ncbi:phosphate acetyltransferase [Cribrihabitans marinus]|uniref:Phosphate acetyltransferase n=1 Tax=Cribrihabitans marinus TaxID=1227549 RepID=A0A1H7BJP3_9RHOB|nr:bifunctional enoyl-CoA hydratase/phosphate acetyltransferase [Cribrihabitans marinus]GGH34411.1 phosphate acetyltransferase [Cribrihabitans marinus]SEJ77456.1 phosphate acetyltransferase [Cribrihabitans marinus]
MQYVENRTFDEIAVGDSVSLSRELTERDIDLFAVMSGDVNPTHVDPEFARDDMFHRIVGHGMWGGALISNLLGTQLPGPGTIYRAQTLAFHRPVALGETITVRLTVRDKEPETRLVRLDCDCVNGSGQAVLSGLAEVIAPAEKVRRPAARLPEVHLHRSGDGFDALIARTRALDPIETAVVHPCDATSLAGALAARDEGLIRPVLVGPAAKIAAAAEAAGLDLAGLEVVDAPHSHAAAKQAVALVRAGRAEALMKGALHTDEIMAAAVDARTGLRTERRMSHVFVLDVPSYPRPLMVTDAAINIAPDLETKADIIRNAIGLGHALGIARPKVAILSAVETITPKMVSTVEAAALCKMADRGQITGGDLDGPLAFDNAVSESAAAAKAIVSPVAGRADVLVAPDLEAGNMIAKQLTYLAGADTSGIVLGARVPIMLTSRADGIGSRVASAALAQLYVRHRAGAVPGTLTDP